MARKRKRNDDDWLDDNGAISKKGAKLCSVKGCSATALYSIKVRDTFTDLCSCCSMKYNEPFIARCAR